MTQTEAATRSRLTGPELRALSANLAAQRAERQAARTAAVAAYRARFSKEAQA
jgi:hypothetical protein